MDRRVARRVQAPLVNGLLLAGAALTLFPLLWMVSVSLMSPGEASSYPPPLVPERATLGNYRELFGRAGVGRYLVNSIFLAAAVTAVSLVFNVAAGYAFAKLRFAGRDRIFKLLLGALQIVALLQIEPEVGTVSAQLAEPQCHDRGYRLLLVENVIESLTRHTEQLGDLRLGPIKRRQNLLAQKFAGVHGRQAALRELLGDRACPQ